MAKRYSTRSRRASGSAAAEPAVGGLTAAGSAPWAGPGAFEDTEFCARLDELRDACAVPGRVVLVTGPAGAGKSVVCEALLADIDPPRCTASVSAREGEPYQRVLTAILEAYGFKVEAGTSQQVMAELIAHHAGDPAHPGRQCVVVVDDAHELALRDLHALLELIDGTALTLVLAGSVQLVAAVERVAEQFSLDCRQVQLAGLSVGDVNAYLEWRDAREAARSGRSAPAAFAIEKVKERARFPGGLPGLLDQVAAMLRSAGGGDDRQPGPFGFPTRHLVALAALVLVLLVVYIVGQFAEQVTATAGSSQRVETLAMPPLASPAEVPGAPAAAEGTAPETTASAPVSRQMELPVPARPEATDAAAASESRAIIARPSSAPTTPVGSTAQATGARPAPESGAAPAPAPDAAGRTQKAEAPAAPAGRTPAPAPSGGAAPRTASWIMQQPAAAYTVQLVSLSSPERARAYIAEQPDPGSFATYRLLRNGQLFHVVVYGSFSTKAQADQAAARLPRSVGNIQPWVRQFGQVQASVRTTPQQ